MQGVDIRVYFKQTAIIYCNHVSFFFPLYSRKKGDNSIHGFVLFKSLCTESRNQKY